jgi:type IX secretion system PorP/SprF family membrane protein
MKKILLYLSSVLLGSVMYAQQLHQSSMYMMNNYLLNPAEGGTEDFIDLQAGYRTQWTGLGNGVGPKTMYFSGHSPIGKHSVNKDTSHNVNNSELDSLARPMGYHGVGGAIISDNAGHFNTIEVKGSYSYHMPVGRHFFLSFGGFLGVKQTSIDGDIKFDQNGDPDPVQGGSEYQNVLNPDLTLGIWGYHKKFYFGVSSFQVLGNSVDVVKDGEKGKLHQHFYFTGGYKVDISKDLFLVPSLLVKVLPGVPVTTDLNAKFSYKQKYWGGTSFRLGNEAESLVLLAGITLKKVVDVGYAYDFTLNGLNRVSNGSHEIIVGLRLPNHQHHAPPKQFW